jgi:methylamine dehydrogenase accessory protein MauD
VTVPGWWVASYVVLWVVVIALAVIVVALARQIGTLHLRLGPRGALEIDDEGPPLGEAPEEFDLTGIEGRPVTVGGPGAAQLVLFVSPGCMVCEQVLPSVKAIARDIAPVVVTDVDHHETVRSFSARNLGVPVVSGREVVASYAVPGTPYVVVLDSSGATRAKGTVNNLEQLEGLIDTARQRINKVREELQATP